MRLVALAALCAVMLSAPVAMASEFLYPWREKSRALVLDGYEFNEFDLVEIAKNKRVVGFIHKASDGLPAKYRCRGNNTERTLCREKWRRYSVARELYNTRRSLAKALGMKWGAYHLGRPGNPIQQAQHFLSYADPQPDDIVVIDIEDNDPDKWMSLKDAERFAIYVEKRLGRWPMLYTNGSTAQFIANNREDYPVLSRLPLWYARFKADITGHFPKGNWETYGIWQFGSHINCNKKRCLYRVKGANDDIDVNVVDMTAEELRAAWPFGDLLPNAGEPAPDDEIMIVARPDRETVTASVAPAPFKPHQPARTVGEIRATIDNAPRVSVPAVARTVSSDDLMLASATVDAIRPSAMDDLGDIDLADLPRSLASYYWEYAATRMYALDRDPEGYFQAMATQTEGGAAPIVIPNPARYAETSLP
ncbi:MAG: GH25 family lysozyme [Pseudomonadota bacterium]